ARVDPRTIEVLAVHDIDDDLHALERASAIDLRVDDPKELIDDVARANRNLLVAKPRGEHPRAQDHRGAKTSGDPQAGALGQGLDLGEAAVEQNSVGAEGQEAIEQQV